MDLETKFKKETGFDAYADNDLRPKVPSDYYVEWLEEQLTLTDVVKTLPNKEKLNFEDWLEFRKIDKLSDGAYRWEGSLYTEYYVKSSYETYLK